MSELSALSRGDATTGRPGDFLLWAAVFVFLYQMLCPEKKPRYGKHMAAGLGIGGLFLRWREAIMSVVGPVVEATSDLYDMLAKGPVEAIEKLLNALKPYLPAFMQPLIDWVLSMLQRFKDALMSPVVKSAILAILGVWLILRMFRR